MRIELALGCLLRCGLRLCHDALLVYLETLVAFELRGDRAVHQHLFPDLHFSRREIIAIHVVAPGDLHVRLAMGVV